MEVNQEEYPDCGKPMRERIREFNSSEIGRHLINCRKELLLALGAMIHREVERLEASSKPAEPRKVEVE